MERAAALPEATPLGPGALLHLGSRAAVDQALSRLARAGRFLRVYMRPIETRYGPRSPIVEKAVMVLAELWGETIVPCGVSVGNVFGLTTQNPSAVRLSHVGSQPTVNCSLAHRKYACAMLRAGNSWHRTARPATPFAPWRGSARERSRTLSRRSPPGSPTTTWPNWQRRARSCRRGWRNR